MCDGGGGFPFVTTGSTAESTNNLKNSKNGNTYTILYYYIILLVFDKIYLVFKKNYLESNCRTCRKYLIFVSYTKMK